MGDATRVNRAHNVQVPPSDDDRIEQRFLDLAYTTDAKITDTALAYFAPCTIEAADRVLASLASNNRVTMEIEDDGAVVYNLRDRQMLARPAAPPQHALVPVARGPHNSNPAVAAILSFLLPGAGHLYAGRIAAALVWFIAVSIGYVLILPGLILHFFNIISAAGAARFNAMERQLPLRAGDPVGFHP